MGMALKVREMEHDDIDAVYAIELDAHRSPWTRDIIHDCVYVNYDCRVLDVQKDQQQELIGFIISRTQEKCCHILNLCIAPAFQGKGCGQFLLKNLIDSMVGTTIDSVLLEVRPSNVSALHLYQKLGFEKVGVKRGYYRDNDGIEDAVVLQKKLA
jgi:ribosomal-protein-alanine N-acetyltransferase